MIYNKKIKKMKQRIEIRLLIKKDQKVLFLKRASGREDLVGKFELPGDRLNDLEQPEYASRRILEEQTGLQAATSYVEDVVSYIDEAKPDLQRIVIVYFIGVSGGAGEVQLTPGYSRYAWKDPTVISPDVLTELSGVLLESYGNTSDHIISPDTVQLESDISFAAKKQADVVIHSDGGSRGNPGPSAAGYSIKDRNDKLLYEGGAYLGITTNNQAEYHGVRLGLEKAKELGAKTVECYIDSMLVVNQLNGQYVIRNRELWPIHERIKELIRQFDKVGFRHVKREFNQQADAVVNRILDAHVKRQL